MKIFRSLFCYLCISTCLEGDKTKVGAASEDETNTWLRVLSLTCMYQRGISPQCDITKG